MVTVDKSEMSQPFYKVKVNEAIAHKQTVMQASKSLTFYSLPTPPPDTVETSEQHYPSL